MVKFNLKLKNPPAEAVWWRPSMYIHPTSYLSEEGNLLLDKTAHFDIPHHEGQWHQLGIMCLKEDGNLIPPPNAPDMWRVPSWWPEEGKTYIFNWASGEVKVEFALKDWLPQEPSQGPPLPEFLNIYWPWYTPR